MEDGEFKTFRRKVHSKCFLTSLHFAVIKQKNIPTQPSTKPSLNPPKTYLMFYAVIGEMEFNQIIPKPIPDASADRIRVQKFQDQIGSIQCMHGWIQELHVEPSLESPDEDPTRCGIGTVLTELCLIDPDINSRREGNQAFQNLSPFIEFPLIIYHCHQLVGLQMAAFPPGGAHTYFNAAINMRYFVLIVEPEEATRQSSINIYPTLDAKTKYDKNTGSIEPCCNHGICLAYGRNWYFCRLKF